jgi:hypothetical protein
MVVGFTTTYALYRPIRNKNFLWWPCLLADRDEMSNLHRGHSIDASCHVSVNLAKQFQRRTWPPQEILVSDWSISIKSLKLPSQMNRNLVGSIYMYRRLCIKFPLVESKMEITSSKIV